MRLERCVFGAQADGYLFYLRLGAPDLQVNGLGVRPQPATSKAADAFRITRPLINGRKCFVSFNRIASALQASGPNAERMNPWGPCLQIKYKSDPFANGWIWLDLLQAKLKIKGFHDPIAEQGSLEKGCPISIMVDRTIAV